MEENVITSPIQVDAERFIQIVGGICSICGLVFSVFAFFAKIVGKIPTLLTILFYASIDSFHIFRAVSDVMPKFQVEATTGKRLLYSSDFHMFILSLFFIIFDYSNIFFILDYIIITMVASSSFFINYISTTLKLNVPMMSMIKQVVSDPIFDVISAVLELLVSICLFFRAITTFKFTSWLLFLIYTLIVNISGIATSEAHNKLWSQIGLTLREFAAKRNDGLGRFIETSCDKCAHFSSQVKQYFPKRDIKVHLQ